MNNVQGQAARKTHKSLLAALRLKLIRDSNLYFRIHPDSDPDICRIAPKMLCVYYLVGVTHFTVYRENRPVTV